MLFSCPFYCQYNKNYRLNVSLTNLPLPLGFPVQLMTSLTSKKDQDIR